MNCLCGRGESCYFCEAALKKYQDEQMEEVRKNKAIILDEKNIKLTSDIFRKIQEIHANVF